MPTLPELMDRDSVTATWFWTTSHDVVPYAEEEGFDVVFVRETNYVVGGGYFERRTLYVQDVRTPSAHSRREHGGDIVNGDPIQTLTDLIVAADEIGKYPTFRDYATQDADAGGNYRDALQDMDSWEMQRQRFNDLKRWLGDSYDEYVKAAQEWEAEH